MSSALSMNARKCVYAQKPYPPLRHSRMNQARSEEEEKERKKRGRETGKTEARRLMERKAVQQNKNVLEELKQGLYGEDKVSMGRNAELPLATECDPLPP